jgi:xylitol oxidase
MEMVKADGEAITLSRDEQGDDFAGAVVGLGGVGVVTKITLDVQPTFSVSQDVYDNLPFAALKDRLHQLFSGAYSVSLFTSWQSSVVNQVWVKRRLSASDAADRAPDAYYGALRANERRHPVPGHSSENCSEQLGIPGPWHERLAHFRPEFTPSAGEELQSEYFVAREHAYEALCAIDSMREQIAPLLHISEVRTIAADELWMSPCYRQHSVGIHFTWKDDRQEVRRLLPIIEQKLAPFNARPHWAKLFTMPPARLQSLYAKLPEFRQLLLRYDPQGKFRNGYLDTYIFGE